MNFRSYLIPVMLLTIGISTYGSDTIDIDLKTATPEQIQLFLQPQYIEALAEQTLNDGLVNIPMANLKTLFGYKELSNEIITKLADADQITEQNALLLAKPAARNVTSLKIAVLQKILAIEQALFLKKLTSNKQIFFPFNDLLQKLTQTKKHLIANFTRKYQDTKSTGHINYQDDIALQAMTKKLIDLEYQEQQKGRYTFVHGHAWHHHFYQEIYTDLWSIANGPVNNYRFIRYTYPDQKTLTDTNFIKEEKKVHRHLMGNGVSSYYTREGYQDRMLFMNYALFTNYRGSNTSYYIKTNNSENHTKIKPSTFISQLHLEHYFTTDELQEIEKKLTELEQEHKALSSYGGALLLSFTAEALKKSVYLAAPGGYKTSIEITGVGQTSDVKTIIEALRTAPETILPDSDSTQFVCVLSYAGALLPHNGVDIYEFNPADQDKLAAWRVKKNELMTWIKERVMAKKLEK
jgi:hypothetical protein